MITIYWRTYRLTNGELGYLVNFTFAPPYDGAMNEKCMWDMASYIPVHYFTYLCGLVERSGGLLNLVRDDDLE